LAVALARYALVVTRTASTTISKCNDAAMPSSILRGYAIRENGIAHSRWIKECKYHIMQRSCIYQKDNLFTIHLATRTTYLYYRYIIYIYIYICVHTCKNQMCICV